MTDKTIPPMLEVLRHCEAGDFKAINFSGLITQLSLSGIAEIADTLEQECTSDATPVPFRQLLLRLLARLAVYQSLCRVPVRSEFWQAVWKSGNQAERQIALLACNMSQDEGLWHLLANAWRKDSRGLNRAFALEIMGTTERKDPARRQRTLAQYQEAVAGTDPWAKFGALHGSLFLQENAAEEIPRRLIGQEKNGRLIASAFAVLLTRNPRRARKIFAAIVGYIMSQRPSPHVAAMLLGVCTLCDPRGTRGLCRRVLAGPPDPRLACIRAGARYVAQHGIADPQFLRRRPQDFACWPATS